MAMQLAEILLDEEHARLLHHLSTEQGRSLTDIVREALDEYFERRRVGASVQVRAPRREIPEDEWRARFEAIRTRLRKAPDGAEDGDDIEAEIGAARGEVRADRAARRSAPDA